MEASKLIFTTHAKERALERMFCKSQPHDAKELDDIEKLLQLTVRWCPMRMKWQVQGFNLELICRKNVVLTVRACNTKSFEYGKVKKDKSWQE